MVVPDDLNHGEETGIMFLTKDLATRLFMYKM